MMRGVKTRAGGTWTEALHRDLCKHFEVVDYQYLCRKLATRGKCTPVGVRVGSSNSNGYRQVNWQGFKGHDLCSVQLEHRIIYFMCHKEMPEQIDHINGERDNNHIANLRASNNRDNQMNRHVKVGKDTDLPIGVYRTYRKGREGVWYTLNMEYNGVRRSTYRRCKQDAINLMSEWRKEHAEKTNT